MGRRIIRLLASERAGLCASFTEVLRRHLGAVVRLFGSRAGAGSGGDIDLLVSLRKKPRDPLMLKVRLKQAIEDELGERKIDIVIHHPEAAKNAFFDLATQGGVVLWKHPRKS